MCAFESTMDIMKEEVEKQLHEQQIIDRSHKVGSLLLPGQ